MNRRFVELLELGVRNYLVYPLLRLVLNNPRISLPLDVCATRSVLVLRYDKIGDMVVTLPVFRVLKSRNPSLRIGVVTSESNYEILRGEDAVDDCFVLDRNPLKLLSVLHRIRSVHYAVTLNFIFNRTTSGALIANFACPKSIKVGQGAEKYRFYFNALLSLPRANVHMLDILMNFIQQVFGITIREEERELRLSRDPMAEQKVDVYLMRNGLQRRSRLDKQGSPFVILNISAREGNKRISTYQATAIATHLSREREIKTVVISAPEDLEERVRIVSAIASGHCLTFPLTGDASLKEIASLVEGASCVITPDTAIVHVASATSTPLLGIFTPLQVNQEWLPYKVKHDLIVAPEGHPVSDIPVDVLIRSLDGFLKAFYNHTIRGKH